MMQYRIRFIILILITALSAQTASADTWRLGQGPDFKPVSDQNDTYLLAVSHTKKLVNTGQTKAVEKAFDKLKEDYPEITGPDLDIFIEAEIFFSRGKFTTAFRRYDQVLIQYPDSSLREAVNDRQFAIGTAYLGGQKKRILGLFNIKGYAEGVKIMEKITDRAGLDSEIGKEATIAVANCYEKRRQFTEAYLKWEELSIEWQTGPVAKEAMLSKARCMQAAYNKHPEDKRPFYDISNLRTARTLYETFKNEYPKDAEEIGIDEIINQINEQLIQKLISTAQYYERTRSKQKESDEFEIDPAKLYFNAAEEAKKILSKNMDGKETKDE